MLLQTSPVNTEYDLCLRGFGGSLWDNFQGCLCVDYCLLASLMARKGIWKLRRQKIVISLVIFTVNYNLPRICRVSLIEHMDSIQWWTCTFYSNKCFPIAASLSSFWWDDLHWNKWYLTLDQLYNPHHSVIYVTFLLPLRVNSGENRSYLLKPYIRKNSLRCMLWFWATERI